LWRSAEAHDEAPPVAGDYPRPGEVLTEIGLLLAIHLAVAFAVALTLRLLAIA
jgi:hypothetical protein